jgi:ATP-dependent Clp protease ATP-binding subunit ClpA
MGVPVLFSRFSAASRRVLRAAEQECRNLNHYYVGVEHLLLALLAEQNEDVEQRLRTHGIVPGDVYLELRRRLGTGEDRVWDGILVTPRARRVVERATDGIDADAEIEPVDLFDAICREDGGLTADLSFRRAFAPIGAN